MKNGKGDRQPALSRLAVKRQNLEKKLRRSDFYRDFASRKFHLPQGFGTWQTFLFGIVNHLEAIDKATRHSLSGFSPNWLKLSTQTGRLKIGFVMEAWDRYDTSLPVYCLDKNLANAFLKTDLPPTFQLKRSHHMGILFIPDGLITSPYNQKVSWVMFAHRLKDEKNILGESKDFGHLIGKYPEDRIEMFLVCDDYKENWFSSCSLERSTPDGMPCHSENITGQNKAFLGQVQTLIIQSLFWLQSKEPQDVAIKSNESGNTKAIAPNTPTISLPRWIGKDYATKTQRIAASSPTDPTASQSSKCMHWRRGHYRMQPIGKERAEVKQIWIEPMLINSENIPSPASK